jgi:uncharacterized membrane protein YgcG
MTSFRISDIIHGEYREVNDRPEYISMRELSDRLNEARQKMQPYFDKYGNAFKSITSNASPMKFLPARIKPPNIQCQNPTNVWIKIYEVVAYNNLIPSKTSAPAVDEVKSWKYYDYNCLPGHSLLAVNHYVYTKGRDDIKDVFEWTGNVQDKSDIDENDYYDIYHNYKDTNFKVIDFDHGDPGDIPDTDKQSYDLFIGTSENHKIHDYLNQELNDSWYLLHEVMATIIYLKHGGSAVFRLTSFFNKFTISVISALRSMFRTVEIFRPMSAKADSMEVYLICKSFYINDTNAGVVRAVDDFLSDNHDTEDFIDAVVVPIGQLEGRFWSDLLEAATAISTKVIKEIQHNISLFIEVTRKFGDDFPKQAQYTKDLSKDKIEETIDKWYGAYTIENLPRQFMLNIRVEQPREYSDHSSRGRGGGGGRGGGRGAGRGGGSGGRGGAYNRGHGRVEEFDADGWKKVGRK